MFVTRTRLQRSLATKKLEQIFFLLIFLLGTIFICFSMKMMYSTIENSSATQTDFTSASVHTLDSKTKQMVNTELQQFTEGFLAQGVNGDPTIQYFIQNPTTSFGFGASLVKMLVKGTSGSDGNEISLTFPNSNQVLPEVKNPMTSKATYFIESNVAQTKQEYATIVYKNLYNHIDLEYTIQNGELKYNFYVYPGGNPANIMLQWHGPISIQQIETGMKITITTDQGSKSFLDNKPLVYQDGKNVATAFDFKSISSSIYGFSSLHYDSQKLLVIDPAILLYSTYLGGSGYDEGTAIALDNNGNVYVTGTTSSSSFPTVNAYSSSYKGNDDAFVLKFTSGSSIVYSTFIGGTSYDSASGIAVDNNGNAYISGTTLSNDFPTSSAYDTSYNGHYDTFALKLSSTGSSLAYSTYVGGATGDDFATGVAIDNNGNAYVTGYTNSTDFPTLSAYSSSYKGGLYDSFVYKLSSAGNTLVYSTYVGGSGEDYATGIAVDIGGNAYVSGYTNSTDFPTVSAFSSTYGGGLADGFVFKLTSSGTGLAYATFIGGMYEDYCNAIAVDSIGYAYITGSTNSTNFPLTNAYDNTFNGVMDVFVVKISPIGVNAVFSTFFGGSDDDQGFGIAFDSNYNVYVTGYSFSTNFPTTNSYSNILHGNADIFVFELSSTGTNLIYSTLVGGTHGDIGNGIVVDKNRNAYVTGIAFSPDFPTTVNAFDTTFNGGIDSFIIKLTNQPTANLTVSQVSVFQPNNSKLLELSWNQPSFTSFFGNYNIYRRTSTSNYTLLGTSDVPLFTDNSIALGITYYYKILPVFSFGVGFNSTEINGILPTIPSSPSLTVTAGNRSVYLNWTAPVNDGGSPITKYEVLRGTISGQYSFVGYTKGSTFNDTNIPGGIEYFYVVAAFNAVGEGNLSLEKTVTPFGPTSLVQTVTQTVSQTITQTTTLTSEVSNTGTTSSSTPKNSPGFEVISFLVTLFGAGTLIVMRKRKR